MTSFQNCQGPDFFDKPQQGACPPALPVACIHIWRMLLKSGSKAKQLQTEN